MKKSIELKINFDINKKYIIYTGFRLDAFQHKNKTFIRKFLQDYKRFLNDNVRSLLQVEASLYQLYKTHYLEISPNKSRKIGVEFLDFNDQFSRIFGAYGADQNHVVFRKIGLSYDILENIMHILLRYSQKHKIYSLNNQLQAFRKTFILLYNDYDMSKNRLFINDAYRKPVLRVIHKAI